MAAHRDGAVARCGAHDRGRRRHLAIVVSRLVRDQETNLTLLANAYLDGLSAAVLPAVVRGDVWETFDALDRARGQYSGVEARYAIVALPNGSVLAASDPARFPIHSDVPLNSAPSRRPKTAL